MVYLKGNDVAWLQDDHVVFDVAGQHRGHVPADHGSQPRQQQEPGHSFGGACGRLGDLHISPAHRMWRPAATSNLPAHGLPEQQHDTHCE